MYLIDPMLQKKIEKLQGFKISELQYNKLLLLIDTYKQFSVRDRFGRLHTFRTSLLKFPKDLCSNSTEELTPFEWTVSHVE